METTNTNGSWTSQKKSILILIVFAVAFAVLTFIPSIRSKLQSLLANQERTVLAKITGYFSADQQQLLVLKIRDSIGLHIEIYEVSKDSAAQVFKQKFDLSEDSDSYVTLDRNSTNLALQDVDQDGNLDIVAPSVDRNGNLRLNTFKYNNELGMFEPYVNQE